MSKLQSVRAGNARGKARPLFALVISLALFIGCATIPDEGNPKDSLTRAVSAYWKLRMEGKYEDTFKMEDKEDLQKSNLGGVPLFEYYVSRAKGFKETSVRSYSLKDVAVHEDKGRVDVVFEFTLPEVPFPVHQTLTDQWVLRNGKWRHLLPQ